MKLEWEGNQKYNEDITKASILEIDYPIKMRIHKYIGAGDKLFFDCPIFGINCIDLETENFELAEDVAMEILKKRLNGLTAKVNTILNEYYG